MFGLIAAEDRNPRNSFPRWMFCPCRSMSPHAEICEQRAIGLWRLATRACPSRYAGGLGAAAHRVRRLLPATGAEPAGGRRDAARGCRRAPGKHRLRAARAGGDGGRIFGARRHPGCLLAGIRQAGAHRTVRRPDGIHPPLRSGIAALGAEGGRLHAAAADASIRNRARCWRNWANDCSEAGVPGARTAAARRDVSRLGTAGAHGAPARQLRSSRCSTGRWCCGTSRSRSRGAAERFWKRLEQIERSAGLRSGPHLLPLGGVASGRPPALRRSRCEELEIVGGRSDAPAFTSPTRPSMAFHGNMQVAIAEARNLVEAGNRGGVLRRIHRRSRARRRHLQRVRRALSAGPGPDRIARPSIWPNAPTWPARRPASI